MALYSDRHHQKRQGYICSTTNVGVDSSCIIYKTIIKMIKILNCRQIKFTNSFLRIKQLFCDSVKKSGVQMEFLKHSRFSHFMGLSMEMKKLSKTQQQNQKKQIRQAQMITTLAIIGIASLVIFLYFNQKFTLRFNTMMKMMSINSGKASKENNKSTQNLLVNMEKYLISNPYQYKTILDSIFLILSSLPSDEKYQEIQQKIEQIYIRIIGHNFKSVTNECLKNGLQKLLEKRYFSQNKIDKKIIAVLLSQGSTKQLYLTLKYLQLTNDTNQILSSDLKSKFIKNYQRNVEKHKQYFTLLFSKIDESKLPIFRQYKKMQQSRLSYLQIFIKQSIK